MATNYVQSHQPAVRAGSCPFAGLPNVRAARLARRIENPAFVGVKSGFPAITQAPADDRPSISSRTQRQDQLNATAEESMTTSISTRSAPTAPAAAAIGLDASMPVSAPSAHATVKSRCPFAGPALPTPDSSGVEVGSPADLWRDQPVVDAIDRWAAGDAPDGLALAQLITTAHPRDRETLPLGADPYTAERDPASAWCARLVPRRLSRRHPRQVRGPLLQPHLPSAPTPREDL